MLFPPTACFPWPVSPTCPHLFSLLSLLSCSCSFSSWHLRLESKIIGSSTPQNLLVAFLLTSVIVGGNNLMRYETRGERTCGFSCLLKCPLYNFSFTLTGFSTLNFESSWKISLFSKWKFWSNIRPFISSENILLVMVFIVKKLKNKCMQWRVRQMGEDSSEQ